MPGGQPEAEAVQEHRSRPAVPELPDGDTPDDWTERLNNLPAHTLVHVPVKFRAQLGRIMTANLQALARGEERGSLLEKGRSKLLYGLPPKGSNLRNELTTRLALWREGQWEELLFQAEAQHAARLQAKLAKRTGEAARQKALRAKKLAAEGAYRKAVLGLTSATAQLSTEEQEAWAKKLLPNIERTDGTQRQEAGSSNAAATLSLLRQQGECWMVFASLLYLPLGPLGPGPSTLKSAFLGVRAVLRRRCAKRLPSSTRLPPTGRLRTVRVGSLIRGWSF